jgi:riboflavin kinase/FMN adenylyltransferase
VTVYEYPFTEKPNIDRCVLALGFFDGVHVAHRDLLLKAKEAAMRRGLSFGIFTFESDGKIKAGARRLYDDEEKAEIFDSLGADFTVFADFSAISGCTPEDFVDRILIDDLCCRICVAGYNFRFGKGASAGAKELTEFMRRRDAEALICDEIKAKDGSPVSATVIRELIEEGKTEEANILLGAPYYIKGRVLHGRADGRKLGFPTANLEIGEGKIVPRLGVYRTAVDLDGRIISAVTNIGKCPTFMGESTRLEAHLIDFDGDLYGREIKVYILGFLRDEMRFDSLEELKAQIDIDKKATIKENGELTWQESGLK